MAVDSMTLIEWAKKEVTKKTGLNNVELQSFNRDGHDAKFVFSLFALDGIWVNVTYRDSGMKWYFSFDMNLDDEDLMKIKNKTHKRFIRG